MFSKSIQYKGCTITIDVVPFDQEEDRAHGGTKYHTVVTSISSPGRSLQQTTKEAVEDKFLEILLLKKEAYSKDYVDKEIDRISKDRFERIGYK
jgi:hypothetical protein